MIEFLPPGASDLKLREEAEEVGEATTDRWPQ
jgi:hypothetical protein